MITLLFVLGACGGKEQPVVEVVRPVRAVKVADSEAFSGRRFSGRAKAVQEVALSFEVAGRMVERPVNVGDRVENGQLLGRLDPTDYQNALDAAVAQRAQAEAYRDRIAQAAKTGAVAEQELTNAQAAYDVAVAQVNIRKKALEDTRLHAPFAGEIAATYVEQFQNVLAKQPVMRLLDLSKIEVVFDIPESLISYTPYVRDLEVEFDAFPGRPVPARIKEVGTEATMATRTYPVTVIMDQPKGFRILPGMAGTSRGRLELPRETESSGLEIPADAVFANEGKEFVWVITGSPLTVTRREVRSQGLTSRGVRVLGIKAGECIATAGVHHLREGQRVRILGQEQER